MASRSTAPTANRQDHSRPAVKARHFGRLSSDQRRAGLTAALRDAFDNGDACVDVELAGGVVVEEEERLRALHHKVIHAHGDQIDADAGMDAGLDGDLEFGADPVIRSDQHRVLEAAGLEIEQSAKAADFRVGPPPPRGAHGRLDAVNEAVAGVDIDSASA